MKQLLFMFSVVLSLNSVLAEARDKDELDQLKNNLETNWGVFENEAVKNEKEDPEDEWDTKITFKRGYKVEFLLNLLEEGPSSSILDKKDLKELEDFRTEASCVCGSYGNSDEYSEPKRCQKAKNRMVKKLGKYLPIMYKIRYSRDKNPIGSCYADLKITFRNGGKIHIQDHYTMD